MDCSLSDAWVLLIARSRVHKQECATRDRVLSRLVFNITSFSCSECRGLHAQLHENDVMLKTCRDRLCLCGVAHSGGYGLLARVSSAVTQFITRHLWVDEVDLSFAGREATNSLSLDAHSLRFIVADEKTDFA